MITWTDIDDDSMKNQKHVQRHELNRLAGTYRFWSDGVFYTAPTPTYRCEKAPVAKF
jgi:hypothetical protein